MKSRLLWVASALLLALGVVLDHVWVCVVAWLVLWSAAVIQDRGTRGGPA